jgi:Family of unknown function (DUF6492)
VSILINATHCHTYVGHTITTAELYIPEQCLPAEPFWFTVLLTWYDDQPAIGDPPLPKTRHCRSAMSPPLFVPQVDNVTASLAVTETAISGAVTMHEDKITLVLPLTLDDVSRCAILMESLRLSQDEGRHDVHEMIVYVPDIQVAIITAIMHGLSMSLSFPVHVYPESSLFTSGCDLIDVSGGRFRNIAGASSLPCIEWPMGPDTFSYAVQMAIKLLASYHVHTTFYLTLDADIVVLQPIRLDNLVFASEANRQDGDSSSSNQLKANILYTKQAIYHYEARTLYHPEWWDGSEIFLNVTMSSTQTSQGFGVTPSILSTFGSMLTLSHLMASVHGSHEAGTQFNVNDSVREVEFDFNGRPIFDDDYLQGDINGGAERNDGSESLNCDEVGPNPHHSRSRNLVMWLRCFGKAGQLWSEYTLYALALEYYDLLTHFHVPEKMIGDDRQKGVRLHCEDVWYAPQLPWRASYALNLNCLTSVVQSSTRVHPSKLLAMYIGGLFDHRARRTDEQP